MGGCMSEDLVLVEEKRKVELFTSPDFSRWALKNTHDGEAFFKFVLNDLGTELSGEVQTKIGLLIRNAFNAGYKKAKHSTVA